MIKFLTPEQTALIQIIRDAWIKIALDTSPTDKQKAEEAIALVYKISRWKPPQQILWFDNPLDAITWIASAINTGWSFIGNYFWDISTKSVNLVLNVAVDTAIRETLKAATNDNRFHALQDILLAVLNVVVDTDVWYNDPRVIEFAVLQDVRGIPDLPELTYYAYFDEIGIDCSQLKGLMETTKHCSFWWAFKDTAVLTPNPSEIRLDSNGELHGEGAPAVTYKGFNIYANHGVFLPEKYGQVHPCQWQAEWLLSEENAELGRVLIQEIGYDRLCRELQAVQLDTWREYDLLRVDSEVDIEPIYLLKMTCPSTGKIHALRVPPTLESAREAIRWVNWEIDPSEFTIQT